MSTLTAASESPLLGLPLELLLRITYHLKTPALGHVRLTCRQAEAALFPSFAREFFQRKRFMLTEFSLRALVDISKSRLGPYLRFLEFGLETVPEGEYWHQNTTAPQDYTAAKLHAEHHVFAETGGDAGLLGEALSNLKSLEDIVVRDTMSYTRRREGSMAPWRSYGTATLFGEYGLDLFRGRASGLRARELSPFKAVLVVLQALASADARIHGIEILLRMGGRAWIGGLQVPIHLQPTLAPVLRHLKKLHLGAAGRYNSRHPFEDETNSFGLRKFMGFVPNLEELRFNGNGLEHDPTLERFLGWLSSPAGAQEPVVLNGDAETAERIEIYSPPAVQLGSLKVLSLGKLGIAPEALKLLICKFAGTLCDLQLWDLLFKVPPDVETREIKAIFRDMLHDDERPLNLKHLKFGRLCYTNYDGHQGFVRFGTRHESGKMTIEYQGSDWKSFLAENIQNLQAIVDRPPPPSSPYDQIPVISENDDISIDGSEDEEMEESGPEDGENENENGAE